MSVLRPDFGGDTRPTTFEPLVDKHAVASVLGKSVSWVEKRCADRTLPSYRVGGQRKFRLSEIEAWLKEAC